MNLYGSTFEALMATHDFQPERAKSMDRHWHAREFRTINMNFGRCTGKSHFALELALENPTDTVIVVHTSMMKEHILHALAERLLRQGRASEAVNYLHTVLTLAELKRNNPRSIGTDVTKSDRIERGKIFVFDEAKIDAGHFMQLAEDADPDTLFVFLGEARIM